MKKILLLFAFLISVPAFALENSAPDTAKQIPDTVKVGIYITSIHDIDFKQNEYSVNLWLWMKYKNKPRNILSTYGCG